MFLRIARVRSTEQSGIRGVKIPFDPNIISTKNQRKIIRAERMDQDGFL